MDILQLLHYVMALLLMMSKGARPVLLNSEVISAKKTDKHYFGIPDDDDFLHTIGGDHTIVSLGDADETATPSAPIEMLPGFDLADAGDPSNYNNIASPFYAGHDGLDGSFGSFIDDPVLNDPFSSDDSFSFDAFSSHDDAFS